MQPENLHILKLLWRKGTSQADRNLSALDPDNIELMGLGVEDWLLFAHNFARFLPYFPKTSSPVIDKDWQLFFKELIEIEELPEKGSTAYRDLQTSIASKLKAFAATADLVPHMTLLVTFLELLGYSKTHLNGITKRHLDFYYSTVLNIPRKAPRADETFLLIEASKSPAVFLSEGELFDAGKDEKGNARYYSSTRGFSPNLAQVAHLKNRWVDETGRKIRISQVANSLDGRGEPFHSDASGWWPFGHQLGTTDFPELAPATFGFGLSFPSLRAAATADRYFKFEFEFTKKLAFSGEASDIPEIFTAHLSGEKGWVTLAPSNHAEVGLSCSVTENQLGIVIYLGKDQPSLVSQDEKTHGQVVGEGFPVIWFDLTSGSPKSFKWIKALGETPVKKVRVKSKYKGIQQPVLESDLGILNPSKPFQPFGSVPKKGSSFYIKYPEWEYKQPRSISIKGKWSNTPDKSTENPPQHFRHWYFGYRDLGENYLSKDNYLSQHFKAVTTLAEPIKMFLWQPTGLKAPLLGNQIKVNEDPENLIVSGDGYFKASISAGDGNNWTNYTGSKALFEENSGHYNTSINISPKPGKTKIDVRGGIKITLLQSFLHELYPRLYALAMSSDQPETPIPNEPYTPLLESLEVDFDCEVTYDLTFTTAHDLQLFLRDDFGYLEEQKSKKEGIAHVKEKEPFLLSFPGSGGELFVGVESLEKNQQLSLLFQVLEGSENPRHANFSDENALSWSVLVDNYWKPLSKDQIVSNQTGNLLQSGIIVLDLPQAALESQTRMPSEFTWIRIKSIAPYDATSRVLGVFAQAVKVKFKDRGNGLEHLQDGLPAGTIGKMAERKAGVKAISQPYNTFGGKAPETDNKFYTRVSERLRHKNRAVSLWDYEHLVLQEFPEVYKVKCLNHTCEKSFLSPGQVTLITVPDTVNKNVYDLLQPTLSAATLNQIKVFLEAKVSPQVKLTVMNPLYEEISIKVVVSFKPGLDKAYYSNLMEEDIKYHLAPWTAENRQAIDFSNSFNYSGLIYFIEKLDYVDFIQQLRVFKDGVETSQEILPKSPRHILVSAKSHDIILYGSN
ncbi:Baseplate J-like protein [Cyclobacterium lianum]|uniref:Baseplate J-like protein n=1 Tax=Cyclobacterium lianum TaxID=388280 RepID=A0A1M7L0E3_9BACT|nr:Baseplate J-like protein [Cyclobacterium lianum]